MIWLLLFLAVLGIAWFMFVPRTGEDETPIPLGDNRTGTGDQATADGRLTGVDPAAAAPNLAAGGGGALDGEVHPAHAYQTGAYATGSYPSATQQGLTPGLDAYTAVADSDVTQPASVTQTAATQTAADTPQATAAAEPPEAPFAEQTTEPLAEAATEPPTEAATEPPTEAATESPTESLIERTEPEERGWLPTDYQ